MVKNSAIFTIVRNLHCAKSAILIIKISFLKARPWRAFKKLILVFPAPSVLETPKSFS